MTAINRAFSFSEIGRKDNQEDYIYPSPEAVTAGQRFFILCDGMGGHDNGEVASRTVAEALGAFLEEYPVECADKDYFNQALEAAYDALDEKDNGATKKMGTTLTCVIINPEGYLAAHIGDSRIYHVRDGKILFRTRDHSLVNDLIKAGELTEEEARTYPGKNVITRALQPNTRRCKADIYQCDDLRPGDYIFMCCDGVLERVEDSLLCEILGSSMSDDEKIAAIKDECDKGTKDNYTCWLIPVADGTDDVPVAEPEAVKRSSKSCKAKWVIFAVVCFILGILIGIYLDRKVMGYACAENGSVYETPIDTVLVQTEDSTSFQGTDSTSLSMASENINLD